MLWPMRRLDVRLLGRFEVAVDAQRVAASAWEHRRAEDLVKLLALSPGHRMTRDQVVEALWPHLGAKAGVANLHKAAYYARKALGWPEAIVVRHGVVALAPEDRVETDVGRDRELAVARSALDATGRKGGGALLILGDAGMGKTRLLDGVLEDARARGWHTLRGAGREEEGRPPYAPIIEAIDPLVAARPDLLESLNESSQRVLALLCPSAPAGDAGSPGDVERHQVFAAVSQLVHAAAGEAGVLMALEDLHAADVATLLLAGVRGPRPRPRLAASCSPPTATWRRRPTRYGVPSLATPPPDNASTRIERAARSTNTSLAQHPQINPTTGCHSRACVPHASLAS